LGLPSGDLLQVRPSTKVTALAVQHRHPRLVVAVKVDKRLRQLVSRLAIDCIADLGTIDDDRPKELLFLDSHHRNASYSRRTAKDCEDNHATIFRAYRTSPATT
jgi:hypothetical protein